VVFLLVSVMAGHTMRLKIRTINHFAHTMDDQKTRRALGKIGLVREAHSWERQGPACGNGHDERQTRKQWTTSH
jgi:hypothetical protein